MNILNCPNCGKIFAKNPRNLCPACIKLTDEECDRCNKYLKAHRLVTIEELSKETSVEQAQIIRFIRDKRISIAGSPNINYSCEACGGPIREGNICAACRAKFTRKLTEAEQLEIQQKKETLNTFLNRDGKKKP